MKKKSTKKNQTLRIQDQEPNQSSNDETPPQQSGDICHNEIPPPNLPCDHCPNSYEPPIDPLTNLLPPKTPLLVSQLSVLMDDFDKRALSHYSIDKILIDNNQLDKTSIGIEQPEGCTVCHIICEGADPPEIRAKAAELYPPDLETAVIARAFGGGRFSRSKEIDLQFYQELATAKLFMDKSKRPPCVVNVANDIIQAVKTLSKNYPVYFPPRLRTFSIDDFDESIYLFVDCNYDNLKKDSIRFYLTNPSPGCIEIFASECTFHQLMPNALPQDIPYSTRQILMAYAHNLIVGIKK